MRSRPGPAAAAARALACVATAVLGASAARAQVSPWSAEGGAPTEFFGRAVVVLDDLNGDGWDDLAVGAPGVANRSGAVRFLSGADGTLLFEVVGANVGGRLGWALAAVQDLDGDGLRDVLAGEPHTEGGSGGTATAAYVFSSAPGGAVLRTLTAPAGSRFMGFSVCAAGDLDGDGLDELAAGDIGNNLLQVFDGATGAWLRSHGPVATYLDGWSCLGGVDLDGDGVPDVGMGGKDSFYGTGGHVTFWSGATQAQIWQKQGGFGEELGASLDWTADLDGDGVPEVLAGASNYGSFGSSGIGFARIFSGASGALLRTTPKEGFGFGAEVEGLPDLDGDGVGDYAVAQGEIELTWVPTTSVRLYSGVSGNPLGTLTGDGLGDLFGEDVAGADLNGDGLVELVVGAPRRDGAAGTDSGSLTLFSLCPEPAVYCTAKTNSLGCTPSIEGVGLASGTLPAAFRIKARQVLSHKAGILIYGYASAAIPFQAGTLCIQPPIRRTPVQSSGGAPPPTSCTGVYSFEFNDRIRSGVDPALVSGAEVFAQYWSRDSGAPFGTGLSDGLSFTICL